MQLRNWICPVHLFVNIAGKIAAVGYMVPDLTSGREDYLLLCFG